MSECKHETWNSVSTGIKWACGECGKFESDIVNQLRQQLAAEQAKSADDIKWALAIMDKFDEQQATIATMRSALEPFANVYIYSKNNDGTQSYSIDTLSIKRAQEALSNTAGAEYAKEREELKAERNKFQKELFELQDKYKQAYGWDKTAKDTAVHLQAAEDRVKKLEEAAKAIEKEVNNTDYTKTKGGCYLGVRDVLLNQLFSVLGEDEQKCVR